MKLTYNVVSHDKCFCCGKNLKDVKPYEDEDNSISGDFCGKCYEKLYKVAMIKKDLSTLGDLMTVSIADIVDLTIEKMGYWND